MRTELKAAPRDASWSNTVGRGGKFHAVFHGGDAGYRACCDYNMVIDENRIEPAHGLMGSEKCQRGGCRVAFNRGYV